MGTEGRVKNRGENELSGGGGGAEEWVYILLFAPAKD